MFTEQCNMYNVINRIVNTTNNVNLWCLSVKGVLDHLGYGNIFYDFNRFMLNYVPKLVQRLRDQYVQQWGDILSHQPKMEYYIKFKSDVREIFRLH